MAANVTEVVENARFGRYQILIPVMCGIMTFLTATAPAAGTEDCSSNCEGRRNRGRRRPEVVRRATHRSIHLAVSESRNQKEGT